MSAAMVWIPVALVAAAVMELWAGLLHARLWHRALWGVHRSHHRQGERGLEANDALSVLHAPLAIALILYGCAGAAGLLREVAFGVGIGMTMFGAAYLVVHDGLVHGRLPVGALGRIPYFARVAEAHRVHHATGRAPHGLFLGPAELRRAAASLRLSAEDRSRAAAEPREASRSSLP